MAYLTRHEEQAGRKAGARWKNIRQVVEKIVVAKVRTKKHETKCRFRQIQSNEYHQTWSPIRIGRKLKL